MIEFRFLMHLAVMDVHGGEKQRIRITTRKRKCHRMNRRRAGFQFENREPVSFVLRQLFPRIARKPKPFVEARKILQGRHKRRFEIPDRNHLESVAGNTLRYQTPAVTLRS